MLTPQNGPYPRSHLSHNALETDLNVWSLCPSPSSRHPSNEPPSQMGNSRGRGRLHPCPLWLPSRPPRYLTGPPFFLYCVVVQVPIKFELPQLNPVISVTDKECGGCQRGSISGGGYSDEVRRRRLHPPTSSHIRHVSIQSAPWSQHRGIRTVDSITPGGARR